MSEAKLFRPERHLLQCPFCGSTKVRVAGVGEDGMDLAVICDNCSAQGPRSPDDTEDNAVAVWNKRESISPPAGVQAGPPSVAAGEPPNAEPKSPK